ncbi:hypothetical protein OAP55_00010 [Alphaproteobacteria bacterium]|nr:hypothetical protein [Alphaproteobacteria bacterium]
MQIASLLPNNYIIFFIFIFFMLLSLSLYFKVKNLIFRALTFFLFLIILINPVKDSNNKSYHKDIILLVSDLSNSIVETNKADQVSLVKTQLTEQIKNFKNVEIINIEIENNLSASAFEKELWGTLAFKEINKKISSNINSRISAIMVITDGQIHDFNNIKNFLDDVPVHFILVGDKNEKDRILSTKNIPNYTLVGNNINFQVKISDNLNKTKARTTFFLDGNQIITKNLATNKFHNIKIPLKHAGKNILEIKVKEDAKEITTLNNIQSHEINGVHDRLRVMLISGEPNMGLRNWRNILNSDPSIELVHFTILRPPSKRDLTPVRELSLIPFPTQELFAADISKFSLIIFDQYSLQGILPPKYLVNISRFVLQGGALLDIAGRDYSLQTNLANSPIKQILPTRPISMFSNDGFKPKLTKLGKRHPITNNLKKNYTNQSWGNWQRFIKSSVLSGKTLMQFDDFPLLVVDEVGEGRVAQILSDQTWIWKKSEDQKGPLVVLLRNTIHWLLKTPEMEEDHLQFYQIKDLVKIKLNSLNPGDYKAKVMTPNNKYLYVELKDNNKGAVEGKFNFDEIGKYTIEVNGMQKHLHLGHRDYKEIENVISTDTKIKKYRSEIYQDNKNFSVFWKKDGLPKIIKIYDSPYFHGKNWIGILDNKVVKEGSTTKKSFFDWYLLLIALFIGFFFSWYKESKN